MEEGWEIDDAEQRKIVLVIPGSSFRLVLSQHRSGSGDRFDETRTGLDHFAFTVEDRAALEQWRRRFEEMGVDHSPIKEGATGWLITFRDPDNTQLEVYTLAK